ncbi:MAG: M16 family metallopeptidase [Prevotella sp.]
MTKYNTHIMPSGLRVIHLPSASPVVYCGYAINAGTRDEQPGEEGMAHFCEHMTFKGTTHRKAWHILNSLDTVGGDLNAFTGKEDTVYHAAVLKEHMARAVDLLTDIVFHSTYPQNEIDKEVEVICEEIESYNDSPAELIYDEFENTVFNGHTLGHNILGKAEKLRTYTTADALRFTRRHYRPANAIFFAYGDVDFNRLLRMLERAGHDTICSETACGTTTDIGRQNTLPCYKANERTLDMHTHLAHVMTGNRAYDIHDPRRMALYLLNNILGGPAMTARLNLSLRERNALVYTVESSMATYSDTGVWAVYFGCDPRNVEKCRRLVRRELDKFMNTPLSDTRMAAAKKQIKGQIGIACDSRENFAIDFAKSFLHYGWEKNIDTLFRNIDAVTPEMMQQVARETFDRDSMTTVMIR